MNLFKSRFFQLALCLSIILTSCKEDNEVNPSNTVGSEGYFIVNEGGFGNGNTSLSFFNRESQSISNNVFETANGIPLGDQSQSMTIHDEKGFIVVQNSAKVEVIDVDDFSSIATISGEVESPRYFIGASDTKGYLSDWGADGETGTVKVIDLDSYSVTKTIPTGKGTNQLLINGSNLYAVNAGAYGKDNTIKVINTSTDEVTKTITVADNPNSLQVDRNGNIWLAASGHTVYNEDWSIDTEESTPGAIIKLDSDGNELMTFNFDGVIGASSLSINSSGDLLYYRSNGAIYSMSTSATELPNNKFIDKSFYGLAVDPFDDTVIGCEAPDFSSDGNILVYSAQGDLLATHAVGIGPNSCTFK